jgi:hypothetical protein
MLALVGLIIPFRFRFYQEEMDAMSKEKRIILKNYS